MSYITKKFEKHAVENPFSLLSQSKFYNVPYSQRNFSWSIGDGDKNQVGKFWNALLRQWQKWRETVLDKQEYEKEISTGKSKATGLELSLDEIDEIMINENFIQSIPKPESQFNDVDNIVKYIINQI